MRVQISYAFICYASVEAEVTDDQFARLKEGNRNTLTDVLDGDQLLGTPTVENSVLDAVRDVVKL